jgi:PI-3-kinase-related kinase SMG-1
MLLESIRLARRQENYKLAKILLRKHILHLTKESSSLTQDTDLSSCVLHLNSSSAVSSEDKLKVMRELSKLNACSGQLPQAIETLTVSITSFSDGLVDTSSKRLGAIGAIRRGSLEGNELVSRSLLSVVKWLQTDTRLLQTIWKGDNPVMQNLQTLLHMEEEVRSDGLGLFVKDQGNWDLFAPEESKYERHEFAMGQLLHLAAVHAPNLAKAWWNLAGWCYRIGRKHLEAVSSSGTAELKEYERKNVIQIVPMSVTSDEFQGIYSVLGQVHAADDSVDELKEAVRRNQEDELNVIRRQLLMVCPALEGMPTLDGLITIWQGVRNRIFKHYELATRAYFRFLHLSGSHPDETPGVDDMNVTATLRLLRLLVKYAAELKFELESGFSTTPTKPWKGIIPQLFSRLNHPDANVRQSVLDLLCRVGADSPHYIIYHAVVGILKRNSTDKPTGMSGFIGEAGSESNFDSGVGVDSVGVDMYSPPDTPVSVEGDNSEQGSSEVEDQNATSLEKCHQAIVDSLCTHSGGVVGEVRALVTELCRVTLLWDEMWLAALMQRQGEVYRRLQQIESEARRTATLTFLTHDQKQAILKKKYDATMKPLIWLLEHLQAVTSQSPETHNERIFQATYQEIISNAIHTLKRPPSYTNPHPAWEPFKEFQQMLMLRSQKRMTSTISLHEVSPHLAAITSSSITLPGLENISDEPIVLESFDLDVMVLPTKTKPKKISMMGSDGRRHTYLFKGLEDLHLDERVMQFMAIINNMFVRDLKHQKQVYRAKDYAVTPLGARSGLIQWIDSATPLFGLYKRWQQREAYANAQLKQQSGQDGGQPPQVQILKPNELFYSKIIPLLKKHGMTEQTPRKEWPREVQRKVLQELMLETPKDLLARELWAASTCATEWWHVTQNYTRSTAVMSIIGYIIGLGDRHLDNLLVEFATGQVIHVDYNVCFEKGKSLRVPEKVPFRMTQNIEKACGFTGVEGLFRISCEEILRILRHGRETLLTLLEAFVYDPLIDWTHSEEAAFPLAIKSPELTGLQTRKEMECEVAEGLLVTRLCERSPHWERCKETLVSVMSQLEGDLSSVANIGANLHSYQDQLDSLDKQVEVLQEALHTPNHPLISMQDRLTEQNRLKMDYDRIMGALREKYKETNEWQKRHEEAFKLMHGASFQDLCSKLHRPPDIGMAGYEIAADFLVSSGQGHTVDLCRQLDQELSGQLQRRRALLNTCLEALLTYCSVTTHYPTNYPEQNRSHAWSAALSRVFETPSVSPDDFQQAITDFEMALIPSALPKSALAVNSKLRKYIQDMYARANKLGERLRSLNSQDVNALEEAVQENMNFLRRFFEEYGRPGAVGMVCFLVMAVSPLIRRWLYMEQTAHSAGERLSDLTSKDGDWFLDELCTMSGNVSQVVDVMEMCIEVSLSRWMPPVDVCMNLHVYIYTHMYMCMRTVEPS